METKKKKVLVGFPFHKDSLSLLEEKFDIHYPENETFTRKEVMEYIRDAEVFVPSSYYKTDSEIIDQGVHLALIANFGAGYDGIDVDYATSKGIAVTNTPCSVTEPTAELGFGLLLSAARRIALYDRELRHPYTDDREACYQPGISLYGKTLGIIGMGRIGQAIARRALAFGMNIYYYNRHRLPSETESTFKAKYREIDELLTLSDVISLNVPSTPETFHLLGDREFSLMKKSAVLLNVGRGALVDQEALIHALENGRIRAAALDVFEHEPCIDERFKKMDNVVITPHVGTNTEEARIDMEKEVVKNITGFFEGSSDISKVN